MKKYLILFIAWPQEPPIAFSDRTKEAGLVEPLAGMMGHGGAWGDVDGDGRVDLFVGGFCDRPNGEYAPAKGPVPSRLLRNKGDGTFEATGQAEMFARTSGAVFADLDGNGTLELYVANNAQGRSRKPDEPQKSAQVKASVLFKNDGGRLVETADCAACPASLLTARNVGVFDYDGDGRLDLLVVEDKFTKSPRTALFRNLGGLKFEDATKAAGLPEDLFGLGLAVADLNGDGRPDFFVAHGNRLFLSKDGKYVESKQAVFDHHPADGEDWPCGAAFGDVNRDGQADLVVTAHHEGARNRLFLNDGEAKFREVTKEAGLGDVVPTKCPHVEIQDFDNDGWPDIFISAAWMDGEKVVPLIYRNLGGAKFEPTRPIKGPMVYFPAGPTADYDGDGRVDILLVNWFAGRRTTLLRNESPMRRWLDVRAPIGSKVRIGEQLRELYIGQGYASGQPAVCHFGLGDAVEVDVEITLPGGKVVKEKMKTDQVWTVKP